MLFTSLTWVFYIKKRRITSQREKLLLSRAPSVLCSLSPLVLQVRISSSNSSTFNRPWPRQLLEPTMEESKVHDFTFSPLIKIPTGKSFLLGKRNKNPSDCEDKHLHPQNPQTHLAVITSNISSRCPVVFTQVSNSWAGLHQLKRTVTAT